jgi:hypothetical protein
VRTPATTWSGSRRSAGSRGYRATIDPASEIPPVDLPHARENRNAPYVYSEREIRELIAAAAG